MKYLYVLNTSCQQITFSNVGGILSRKLSSLTSAVNVVDVDDVVDVANSNDLPLRRPSFVHDDDDGVSTSRLALGFELWSLLRRDQRWVLKFSSLSSKSCSSCCCCVSDRHRLNKTTIETRQTVNKYLRNSGIAANCWMPNQDICPNSKTIHRKYSSTESRYRFVKLFWHNQTLKLHF